MGPTTETPYPRVAGLSCATARALRSDFNQNDALVSFVYNVGGQAFGSSTLLRLLNESKYDQVPAELRR
jgi:GH24 family phage-related lysozyme (muramidase)